MFHRLKFIAGFTFVFVSQNLYAQTLCNVTKVSSNPRTPGLFEVSFDGKHTLMIATGTSANAMNFNKAILDQKVKYSGNIPLSVSVTENERIFISDGLSRSCIIYPDKKNGREGYSIEEINVSFGAPLVSKTEFVENY